MVGKLRVALLAGAVLVLGSFLVFWWGSPRLLSVSPSDGSAAVPAGSPLRLVFSQTMREDSVLQRLNFSPAVQGDYSWQGKALIFTPQQPWPAGQTVQVELKAGSRASGLLPLSMRQDRTWSFTIGQPRLAYLFPADGPAQLYALNPYTGENEQLTDFPGGIQDFDVSASGGAIYFSARNSQGGSDIYRLEPGQGEAAQGDEDQEDNLASPLLVLACPDATCRAPAVSPAGDYLAYERTGLSGSGTAEYPQVWFLPLADSSLEGGDDTPLAPADPLQAGDPAHQTLQPEWSSQGLLSFYDTQAQAFVVIQPGGGERARFPNQTGQPGAWHPDGGEYVAAEISYLDANISENISGLQSLANSHLILHQLEGSAEDLTKIEVMEDTAPAFSPDGKNLAFARKFLDVKLWTPGRQLWLMQMTSGETRQLTDDGLYNHFDFAWSPAGDLLAYTRFNQTALTEPPEIWLTDPLTAQAVQLVQGGYSPQWLQ
jgi:dipeptidyl aminopeptidase/acylaminoacyl peptidase